jgi:hypothetical protein
VFQEFSETIFTILLMNVFGVFVWDLLMSAIFNPQILKESFKYVARQSPFCPASKFSPSSTSPPGYPSTAQVNAKLGTFPSSSLNSSVLMFLLGALHDKM